MRQVSHIYLPSNTGNKVPVQNPEHVQGPAVLTSVGAWCPFLCPTGYLLRRLPSFMMSR